MDGDQVKHIKFVDGEPVDDEEDDNEDYIYTSPIGTLYIYIYIYVILYKYIYFLFCIQIFLYCLFIYVYVCICQLLKNL
jgi:Ca2+/Na+ antiporter